jgi:hypothetical protein
MQRVQLMKTRRACSFAACGERFWDYRFLDSMPEHARLHPLWEKKVLPSLQRVRDCHGDDWSVVDGASLQKPARFHHIAVKGFGDGDLCKIWHQPLAL